MMMGGMILLYPPWPPSVLQVMAQETKTGVLMSRGDILMATLKVEMMLCFIRRRLKQMLNLSCVSV